MWRLGGIIQLDHAPHKRGVASRWNAGNLSRPWYSGCALVFKASYAGSIPAGRSNYGLVAERMNAPVLKTGKPIYGFAGSNPAQSANIFSRGALGAILVHTQDEGGSNPPPATIIAEVAQTEERLIRNQDVACSSQAFGTILGVAQAGRAPALGAGSRWFESSLLDHQHAMDHAASTRMDQDTSSPQLETCLGGQPAKAFSSMGERHHAPRVFTPSRARTGRAGLMAFPHGLLLRLSEAAARKDGSLANRPSARKGGMTPPVVGRT